MTTRVTREHYIPFNRAELIDLCLADDTLDNTQAAGFRRFCEILAAFKHHEFHKKLEHLKELFRPVNPDNPHGASDALDAETCRAATTRLREEFESLLERANFERVDDSALIEAFTKHALIQLRTRVALDDFEEMRIYARGCSQVTVPVKERFRTKTLTFDNYNRVAVLLQFKDKAHFESKKRQRPVNFEPGKTYLFLYKNIPRFDLEVLLPNLETRMNLLDMVLFGVPAAAVAVSVLLRVLPNLLLIFGVLMLFTFGPGIARNFGVDETTTADVLKLWAAISSICIGLGGYAFRQWSNYRSKQIRFQKQITETLFFKNIASNMSVFFSLIDAAEEEECKEMILVYYHLLTHEHPLSPSELDRRIELWFQEKHGIRINFDIEHTVMILEQVCTCFDEPAVEGGCLLRRDGLGRCVPLPLDEANRLLDKLWDCFFPYANGPAPA